MRGMVKLAVATAAMSAFMATAATAAQIRYDLSATMSGVYYGGPDGSGSFSNMLARISVYGDTTQLGQAYGVGQNPNAIPTPSPNFNTVALTYGAFSVGPISGAVDGSYFGGIKQVLAESKLPFPDGSRVFALTEVLGTSVAFPQLQQGGFFKSNDPALLAWNGLTNLGPTAVTSADPPPVAGDVDIALKDGTLIDQFGASNLIFSATVLDGLTASSAFLPNAPSANPSGFGFLFDAATGAPVFIDPLVATGYDYILGAGSPLISQALFPTIAGSNYKIYALSDLVNPLALSFVSTPGGLSVDFSGLAGGGINGFRLSGINVNAGVDPYDANAFVTGLTFASAGKVSISQVPLTVEIGVPEPATWAMMILGLGALGAVARRRRAAVLTA